MQRRSTCNLNELHLRVEILYSKSEFYQHLNYINYYTMRYNTYINTTI